MSTPSQESASEVAPVTVLSSTDDEVPSALVTAPRSELVISALLLITTAAMLVALFTSAGW
ncbi:hypothetical protein VX037_23400 [Gordonia sp. Z-3]|jgi:hypothetical protein|uniref:Uncharacterized protein n=1 Tax=Gordonia tangerina TaxID=2911060 RepID=A0ABS9DH24_9ACTN|nr:MULTISPECIES: hypothetical protein [Gordonia]MCF3938532.1 hypothetical protein [Gordonia tangerina]MED5803975.1 hypothetical protein [Gordonia sp. Z-3]